MKRSFKFLAVLALATTFSSWGARPSANQDQFCADRLDGEFVKQLASESRNFMAFRNQGGIGNGGVCWWHSRFQRNALYLTIFKPEQAMPTIDEAQKLIKKIRAGKEIIEIPGFDNFEAFTARYRVLIQKELELWQKADGAKFAWIRGLKGTPEVTPEKMKTLMDELYDEVEGKGNIAYQKLQIKGITAHAWLVINMDKTDTGYVLEVLDSNFPSETTFYKYQEGQTHFVHWFYGNFTPYLEETKEMERLNTVIQKQCGSEAARVAQD